MASAYRSKTFDYSQNYKTIDLRRHPEKYQVGRGEQGVLLAEPYKSEILPYWRFKDPRVATRSAQSIRRLFRRYKRKREFVGMDMARKFLQMGYTRASRYANHSSGRKYGATGSVLPFKADPIKAKSARIFYRVWKEVEADVSYQKLKAAHKARYG